MQYNINEAGCKQLSEELLNDVAKLNAIITAIENNNSLLRMALGDDYHSIARSVNIIKAELIGAQNEINIINNKMNEYILRVGQAKYELG